MAELGLEGNGAVLGVAGLAVVAAEDGHVGAGDHQQAAIGYRLNGGVEEGRRAAVRV